MPNFEGADADLRKKLLTLWKFGDMATESLDKSLSRISEKMHVLAQRYGTVCQERTQALERIAELEKELRDKERRIEQLSLHNEYLSVSSTLAPDRDAVEKTRTIIADLVREIDRCIADIDG